MGIDAPPIFRRRFALRLTSITAHDSPHMQLCCCAEHDEMKSATVTHGFKSCGRIPTALRLGRMYYIICHTVYSEEIHEGSDLAVCNINNFSQKADRQ